MTLDADVPRVAIQTSQGVVVASIQVELEEAVLARFQDDLLGRVQASSATGVIFDLSGLETLDSHEFAALRRISRMVRLLGGETVLAGLRPGIVSALIESGADVDGVTSALDLDAAFALLRPEPDPGPEPDAEDDGTDDDPDADSSAEEDS